MSVINDWHMMLIWHRILHNLPTYSRNRVLKICPILRTLKTGKVIWPAEGGETLNDLEFLAYDDPADPEGDEDEEEGD